MIPTTNVDRYTNDTWGKKDFKSHEHPNMSTHHEYEKSETRHHEIQTDQVKYFSLVMILFHF